MRALFLGHCGPVPGRVLWAWIEAGHSVSEVWTSRGISRATWRKDRHLGWGAPRLSTSAAIRKFALTHRRLDGLADPAVADRLVSADADVVISVFFPFILPRALLEGVRAPIVNLHPTLLPRYRGPTPLAAMLTEEAGDQFGGVTLHRIVPKVDAGPIIAAARVPLPPDRNPRRWEVEIARAAARLAVAAIPDLVAGKVVETPQDEAAASFRRMDRSIFAVNPTMTAARIDYLLATIGWFGPVELDVAGEKHAISRIVRRLGPPTGAPPRLGSLTIDADLPDGRYRLRRRPIWEGRRIRWATFLLRARERA